MRQLQALKEQSLSSSIEGVELSSSKKKRADVSSLHSPRNAGIRGPDENINPNMLPPTGSFTTGSTHLRDDLGACAPSEKFIQGF